MMNLRTLFTDPMLRVLAATILLAVVLPITGAARPIADATANLAIFVLFLLNGMRVPQHEVRAGLRNLRFLVPLILWVFVGMALIGAGLAFLAGKLLPPVIALGVLYLGALPSTVQSATSYASLAGGNVALSVISAALLNLLGVLVTIPIFLALGGGGDGSFGWDTIEKIAVILLLPFALGQLAQKWTAELVTRHREKISWIDRFVIGLAVYVAFSGAVEQDILTRVDPDAWLALAGLIAAFLLISHLGAWTVGALVNLPRRDRISFLFAGAQKSAAVGVPLATILFPPEIAGFVVVPLLFYHLFLLVVAAPLATRLALPAAGPDCGDYTSPTTRS